MRSDEALKLSVQHHKQTMRYPYNIVPSAWLEDWENPETGKIEPVAIYYWTHGWVGVLTSSYPHYGSKKMRPKEADRYFGERDDWTPYTADNVLNVSTRM